MGISQEDIDNCKSLNELIVLSRFALKTHQLLLLFAHITGREAFLAFDKDRSGTIDVWELRQVLEAMGQAPTEDELFTMISEVDENMSGSIDFGEVSLHYLFNVFHFISTLLLIHYI